MAQYSSTQLVIEDAKRIIGLKTEAVSDYIAARVLFNNNCLKQACLLANTALEKELKAWLEAAGTKVTIHHETDKIFKLIKPQKQSELNINVSFLKCLSKIYQSRYFEKLSNNYNYVILKNKFLAELDVTYQKLEAATRFGRLKTNRISSPFEQEIQRGNPLIILNNFLLSNTTKEQFLKQEEIVNEFRIYTNHEPIEIIYKLKESPADLNFMIEGVKPINELQFNSAFFGENVIADSMTLIRSGEYLSVAHG
ncbi:HEPN domain-containing protein [Sediminibacterium soli]|uniref:HEPN domain-containing protein n=1 Tax=Sediminibacterium soli TaxID=2698829 RepID=UPI001379910F|nr:HEPN domain-containing protein [Sediminibacterium soli]NCI45667.1 HEPN domain-containing protein [Sediminibacterium soli]